MRIRVILPVLGAVVAGLLGGCSPTYNWRTVSLAGGAVSTVLPSKPVDRSRTLEFAGHKVTLTFMLAQVDDALFAVGYAPMPPALRHNEQLRTEMGKQVMASFYRGLALPVPDMLPEFGTRFSLESTGTKKPTRLQAVVWVTDQALVEAMVTSDATDFPTSQAKQFLESTKVH